LKVSCFGRRVLMVAVVAAFAAVPEIAASPPALAPTTLTLATTSIPAKLGGKPYRLRVEVQSTAGRARRALTLSFTRSVGVATQEHTYAFSVPRASFSCGPTLRRCRLATGRALGRFGRVDLTFGATSRRRSAAVGAGCTGTAMRTPGTVAGTISVSDRSLSVDVSKRYGTGRVGRLRSALGEATVDCSRSRTNCNGRLFGLGGDPASGFALLAPASGEAVAQFSWTSVRTPATIDHSITVRNIPPANYAIASDLATASFNAQGVQFLSGSVAYTASTAPRTFASRCGQGTATLGGVTGDVAAVFDGAGRRPLSATGGYLESLP
jgi:hypothetical protein